VRQTTEVAVGAQPQQGFLAQRHFGSAAFAVFSVRRICRSCANRLSRGTGNGASPPRATSSPRFQVLLGQLASFQLHADRAVQLALQILGSALAFLR
jgi:hypothetical protein